MIENYVTSFVEGRIRLRHPIFKDSEITAQIEGMLVNIPGVEYLKSNIRSGSFLIKYDEEQLDQETLFELLKQGEQLLVQSGIELSSPLPQTNKACCNLVAPFSKLTTREKRKIYNRTMAVFLGISALAIGVGNERVHAIAGGLFLGLSLWHIKRMRKSLL